MFVAIAHNAGKAPSEVIGLQGRPSHIVVEEYQRKLAARGLSTGVTWQCADDLISGLVAAHRLDRMTSPQS